MRESKAIAEFDKALRGERTVFCLVCGFQTAAVLDPDCDKGPLRRILPLEHNCPPPINRARCRGSWMQALLSPRAQAPPPLPGAETEG